jgi:hypothetical protein
MKVNIGKYPTRLVCNVLDNHLLKKYNYYEPHEYDTLDKMIKAIDSTIQGLYNIINKFWFDKQERNISVKIDSHDIFNMDITLGYIVLPMLKEIRKHKHGAPLVDNGDVPDHLHRDESEHDNMYDIDDHWFERWDYIIDEMIWTFESILDDDFENKFYVFEDDEQSTFGTKITKYDKEEHMIAEERIKNGLRLFGKYYRGLWT